MFVKREIQFHSIQKLIEFKFFEFKLETFSTDLLQWKTLLLNLISFAN